MSDYKLSQSQKDLLTKLKQEKGAPSAGTAPKPMPKGKADTPLPVVSGNEGTKQDGYEAIMKERRIRR